MLEITHNSCRCKVITDIKGSLLDLANYCSGGIGFDQKIIIRLLQRTVANSGKTM